MTRAGRIAKEKSGRPLTTLAGGQEGLRCQQSLSAAFLSGWPLGPAGPLGRLLPQRVLLREPSPSPGYVRAQRITGCKAYCERNAENKQQVHFDPCRAFVADELSASETRKPSPSRMNGEGRLRVDGTRQILGGPSGVTPKTRDATPTTQVSKLKFRQSGNLVDNVTTPHQSASGSNPFGSRSGSSSALLQ